MSACQCSYLCSCASSVCHPLNTLFVSILVSSFLDPRVPWHYHSIYSSVQHSVILSIVLLFCYFVCLSVYCSFQSSIILSVVQTFVLLLSVFLAIILSTYISFCCSIYRSVICSIVLSTYCSIGCSIFLVFYRSLHQFFLLSILCLFSFGLSVVLFIYTTCKPSSLKAF